MKVRGAIEQNEDGRLHVRRITKGSILASPQHTVVLEAPVGVYARNELVDLVPEEAEGMWDALEAADFPIAPFLTPDRRDEYVTVVTEFLVRAIETYPAGAFRGLD